MPGLADKAPNFRRDERNSLGDMAAYLFDKDTGKWRQEVLLNLFNENEMVEIQKLQFPQVECEDMFCWTATKDGIFSIKSCFDLLANETRGEDSVWRLIWDLKLYERLKLFLWRFASNIISVNMVVVNRFGRGDRLCSLCGIQ